MILNACKTKKSVGYLYNYQSMHNMTRLHMYKHDLMTLLHYSMSNIFTILDPD